MSQEKNLPFPAFNYTLALYQQSTNISSHGAKTSIGPAPTEESSLLRAQSDIEAIRAWLAQYLTSSHTFNSYRKEAERLLLWMQDQGIQHLADLKQEDFLRYQYFLSNPQPSHQWIMPRGSRLSRKHPQWRPFAGPLSQSSIQQALTVLNSMLQWLVKAQYLNANPLSLVRYQRSQNKVQETIKRYIPQHLWQEVLTSINALPKHTAYEKAQYHRYRWLFSLLYVTGLRVSELCQHTMADFYAHHDRYGQPRWWLKVLGKGKKLRDIPITTELIKELSLYRGSLGLPPTPLADETIPLLLPLNIATQLMEDKNAGVKEVLLQSGNKAIRPLTRATIHRIVKNICQQTAIRLRSKGEKYQREAALLEQASPHWIRHTAGTHMVENQIDILHIRDTLGHSSLQTTNRYLHTAELERHEHTEDKHSIGWS